MWFDHPLFLGSVPAVIIALGAWLVSWIGRQRARLERKENELDLESRLRALRLEQSITEQERENTKKLAEQTVENLFALGKRQESMAIVLDATHEATNSGRTAVERLLADVRGALKATEVELATEKALHQAQMTSKEQRIDDLQRQLTAMALQQVPPTAVPGP